MSEKGEITIWRAEGEDELWFASKVYMDSFPPDERRSLNEWVDMSCHETRFSNNIIKCDGQPVGIITIWHLRSFCYIEHFALSENSRGQGIGGRALDELLSSQTEPVLLEVEIPEPPGSIAERRALFYKRHGFRLWPGRYIQPPYSKEQQSLELRIMYHLPEGEAALSQDNYDAYIKEIYRDVYHVDSVARSD
jgi:GNAT superfamily N-acetyltransferase